jgi:multiple sugar transport system substrate-binding protein
MAFFTRAFSRIYSRISARRLYRAARRFALLSAYGFVVAALSFGGECARQSESGEDVIIAPEEITFWHFRSEPKQRKVLSEIVARFEKQENCTVKMVDLTWGEGKTKLFAAFNAGVEPDVVELGSDWVAQFSAGGVLKNLSKSRTTLDKFADFTRPPALWRDSVYALPWNVDARVMFYNKDLLAKAGVAKAPTTAAELLRASEAIQALGDAQAATGATAANRVYGFGANGSDEHRLHKKILPFFWSAGGRILDDSGKAVINSKENIQALTMYLALARAGFIETQRYLDQLFTRGKLGFWISGSWLLDKIARENPSLSFGVTPLPSFNGKPAVSIAGGNYIAVTYKAKNPVLAKRFALYLTDGEQALELLKGFQDAGIPADARAMRDEYVLSKPHREAFVQQLTSSRMAPIHPHWLDIERVIEDAVVEALYGIRSPEQALNKAQWLITDIVTRP